MVAANQKQLALIQKILKIKKWLHGFIVHLDVLSLSSQTNTTSAQAAWLATRRCAARFGPSASRRGPSGWTIVYGTCIQEYLCLIN